MLRRRTFTAGMLALLAGGRLSARAESNAKPERPDLRIVVAGTSSTIYFWIPMLTRELGYFRDEGLNIEWFDSGSGSKGVSALVAGGADLCTGSYEHTIHMQNKKIYLQSIAAFSESAGNAMGVSKSFAAKFKGGKIDLKGANMGISGPGSSTHMFATLVCEQLGLKRDDVSYIAVGTSSGAVAAVRGGKVDGVSNVDPITTELVEAGDMVLIADGRRVEDSKKIYGGPYAAGCIYTGAEFVERNPNTVQAITNAVVRTLKWLPSADPDKIMATLPKAFTAANPGLYRKALAANIGGWSRDGMITPEAAATVLKNVAKFDPSIDPANIDLTKTYASQFAERALQKFS